MCYCQINVAAVDESTSIYFKSKSEGLKTIEGLMPDDYLVAILNGYNKEFNDEFNSFAEEYIKSEEFIELSTKFRKHHRILKYTNKKLYSKTEFFYSWT